MAKIWLNSDLMKDRSGNVLMIAALALPAVLGASGLALDTIQWTLTQRQLQREADSAALSGAYAKSQGTSAKAAAMASITRDNLVKLSAAPIIENAPNSGSYSGDSNAVRVVLESSNTLPFSSMFLKSPPRLKGEATAAAVTNGRYCIIALEHTATTGVTLQGNADVDLGCGIATNSKATQAIATGGSSYVNASHIAAVGGLKSSVNYAQGTVLLPYSSAQKDPFSSLPSPVLPSCSAPLNVQPNTVRNVTNPTGIACYRGMDIKGVVNFAPGIYYIDGGAVSIGAQATVTGTGVTFILTSATASSNPSSIATMNINGGATINLIAKNSGTYAGVLFYQDRRATAAVTNSVNGNARSMLQGAIYFPSQYLSFSGNSGMRTECVQIVSRRVTFIGNNEIVNDCPSDSGARDFLGTRVFLVG